MSQPIRGLGGHLLFFQIGTEKHKLGRERWHLASCQVLWFLVSGFKGEVEYVAANQRLGQPSCFSYRPEKHKLCRWRWDIASCWVLLNSVQKFKVRSRNVSANQRRSGHLDFQMEPKNTNFQEDVEILLPVKFHLILFSGCRGEVENVFQVRDQGDYLLFLIGPKITNFVENVALLLPVKFCWILYINVIGKVENVKSLWRMTVDRQRVVTREERRDLTQSYEKKTPTFTDKSKQHHDNMKNATKNFDYTTIADRLRTVSWSNSNVNPTGVVKPV